MIFDEKNREFDTFAKFFGQIDGIFAERVALFFGIGFFLREKLKPNFDAIPLSKIFAVLTKFFKYCVLLYYIIFTLF